MAIPSLRAGGLASGLSSDSIIESVMTLQTQSLTKIDSRVTAAKVKISALATLATKLNSLQTAADELGKHGLRSLKVNSTNTAFSAETIAGAVGGRFDVEVTQLASAAKSRSSAFASETSTISGGTLHFDVDGVGTDVEIVDGATLQEAATAINDSGGLVTAAVLFDGTNAFLSVTRTNTGHIVGELPSTALAMSMTTVGSSGETLSMAVTQQASNSVALVDGLRFERPGSSIVGAIPGVSLTATRLTTAPETVVVGTDFAKTEERLKSFVDSYNVVNSLLQSELNVKVETDRSKTLAGDGVLRLLQQRLRATLSASGTVANVPSVAELGLKTGRDGSLTLDSTVLRSAVGRSSFDVDRLFAASGALQTALSEVVVTFAKEGGIIDTRKAGLTIQKKSLENDRVVAETRATRLQERLIAQFGAMEKIVSSLNATGSFLTSVSNAKEK